MADDGTRFDCNGTDCEEAAQLLAEHMCVGLMQDSPEEFEKLVAEILLAADEQITRVHEELR